MKWYNKSLHQVFLKDLDIDLKHKKDLERYVLKYAKLVLKHARSVNLEEGKIGVLDFNDIVQMGFGACIEAWNSIDEEKLQSSKNKDKAIINYLSSNISGRIRRYILAEATGVKIPQWVITKTRQELMADSLFGNWMYSFRHEDVMAEDDKVLKYMDIIEWTPESASFEDDNLNEELTTVMFKYLNDKEREIVRLSFGVDCDKMTSQKIGEMIGISDMAVRKRLQRAMGKLDNAEAKESLKDFI